MTGKKLKPFGDKLLLREAEEEEQGVVIIGREVLARVVAVGEGIPYGRGEFYAPVAKEGMLVIVPRKVWDDPNLVNTLMWEGQKYVVVSERLCMAGVLDV